MQALGNDFVVFETLTQTISITTDLIKKMADRHFGIGCDQVLIIGQSSHPNADFSYTIYNNDGSLAKQCGNGARCVGLFIKEKNLSQKNKFTLVTGDHLTHVDISDIKNVSVDIGIPLFEKEKSKTLGVGVLSVGNPHVIIQTEDVAKAPVEKVGASYNPHPLFPEGVNVSFCQIISRQHVKLRVFERGVGETLACGSAACATMAYLHSLNLIDDTALIDLPGGQLHVSWKANDAPIVLAGDAHFVFTGIYPIFKE